MSDPSKYHRLLSVLMVDPEGQPLLEALEGLAAEKLSYAILTSEDCLTIKLLYDEDIEDEDVKFMTGGYSTRRLYKPHESSKWLGLKVDPYD